MRIAIPCWQGRVSPVFDVAEEMLLLDVGKTSEPQRENRSLLKSDPLGRARELANLHPDILICGAISLALENALLGSGIQVVGFVCGNVEEIVAAFLTGDISDSRFLMPGSCSKRRRVRLRDR